MRTLFIIVISLIIVFPSMILGQDKEKYTLSSERLDNEGKELDTQIFNLNNKIQDMIKQYDLISTKGIRILPYQTTYNLGSNFIEIERHVFTMSVINPGIITGIKTKKIKIFSTGQTISRIESKIYEKNFNTEVTNLVLIVDPSPGNPGTDDILFTHIIKGKTVLNKKKFGNIKNSTAYPVRNEVKRQFLIPHLTEFYNSLLFIAESYYKSVKDSDSNMSEFLRKSTVY